MVPSRCRKWPVSKLRVQLVSWVAVSQYEYPWSFECRSRDPGHGTAWT